MGLLSYVRGTTRLPMAFISWQTIQQTGGDLLHACRYLNGQGGAGITEGELGFPPKKVELLT